MESKMKMSKKAKDPLYGENGASQMVYDFKFLDFTFKSWAQISPSWFLKFKKKAVDMKYSYSNN